MIIIIHNYKLKLSVYVSSFISLTLVRVYFLSVYYNEICPFLNSNELASNTQWRIFPNDLSPFYAVRKVDIVCCPVVSLFSSSFFTKNNENECSLLQNPRLLNPLVYSAVQVPSPTHSPLRGIPFITFPPLLFPPTFYLSQHSPF